MKSFLYLLSIALTMLYSLVASSQIGQPDLSFNPTDYGYDSGVSCDDVIYSTVRMNDGGILIGGEFIEFNNITVRRFAKLDNYGRVVESFINGNNFNDIVREIHLQNDGKILVGGDFTMYDNTSRNRVIRLNNDGTVDASFAPGTGAAAAVRAIAEQTDGKILVGGDFVSFNGQSVFRLVRLNSDGSIDSGFQTTVGVNNVVQTICVQDDGKILVGGSFYTFNGQTLGSLIRLNSDGTLDNDFTTALGAGVVNYVQKVLITPDNKILVAGGFTAVAGVSYHGIAQINLDGSLDTNFNPGTGFTYVGSNGVNDLEFDSNGKIVVVGAFTNYNGYSAKQVARLNADGSFDSSFDVGTGAANNPIVFDLCLASDDRPVVVGNFTLFNGEKYEYISKLNGDGSIDESFCGNTGFQLGYVQVFKELSDGRILVGGYFDTYFGETAYGILMINPDGSRDNSFNLGNGLSVDGSISAIEIDQEGNFILGGFFTSIDGQAISNLAKVSPEGFVDTFFTPNPNGSVLAILIEPDNDVIVGGNFTTLGGQAQERMGRVTQFGVYDQWFVGEANAAVRSLAWLPDGTIIVGGDFSNCGGAVRNKISHLNANGASLFDFNGNGLVGTFYSLQVQSDGKIVVSGNMVSYNGTAVKNPLRINSDGSLDTSFNVGTGAAGIIPSVHKTVTQADGKVVAVGEFTSMNGSPVGRIVRLNSNGSIDTSFDSQLGANKAIRAVSRLSTGQYLIGGDFTAFNSIGRNRIAAIESCSSTTSSIDATACDTYTVNDIVYATSGVYTQVLPNYLGCDSLIILNLEILESSGADFEETSCGPYFWSNVQYDASGFYTQTFANSVGCDSIITLDLTVINLNMNVNQNGNTLTSSEAGAQYQWLDCTNGSVEIPNAINQSFTPTVNGSYAVVVTENGCSDVSNCVDVTTIIGVEELLEDDDLIVYPNPFTDNLIVTIGGQGMIEVEVLNSMGELVMRNKMTRAQSLDVSALACGVYTVRVSSNQQVFSKVVVK